MELFKKHPLLLGSFSSFICFLLIFSLSALIETNPKTFNKTESVIETASTVSATKMPRDSFIRFEQVFINSSTRKETPLSLGSGVSIHNSRNGTLILTNNHVCNISISLVAEMALRGEVGSIKNIIRSLNGQDAEVIILKRDTTLDMCVVFAKDFYVPSIKLSNKEPKIGEFVYIIGAPRGYYSPKYSTVPILQGIFNGYDLNWQDDSQKSAMAVYSIRIAPGNSGSAVLNKKGELVGIIHSHMIRFDEISWGTTYADTKNFIKAFKDIK